MRLAAAALVAAISYAPAVELCRFGDPAIAESSGVAASARSDDVFFTHNDSGDEPRFFAVDRSGATVATIGVRGAEAFDWEDMARGTHEGEPALFLGDIGDNIGQRRSVVVYVVREPAELVDGAVPVVRRLTLRYDDGRHDAEALLVDPGNVVHVVTKDGGVYRADAATLRRVGEVRLDGAVTGGDVAPDGSRVVLRTLLDAFEWDVAGGDVAGALSAATPRRLELPLVPQGEAVAYTRDGRSLVTTSEGAGAPVHLLRGKAPVAPQIDEDDDGDDEGASPRWWRVGVGAAALSLALPVLAGRRRRRRRRRNRQARPA